MSASGQNGLPLDAFSRIALDNQQFPHMQALIVAGGKKKTSGKKASSTKKPVKKASGKKVAKKTGKK